MSARRDALLRAAAATRPRRRLVALSVLLGTGAVLAATALLSLSGYLVSRAAQRPDILLLTTAIVGVRFFAITRAILRYLERLASHDLAFRTLTDLRVRFFRRLVPLVPGGLPDGRSSDLLSRFVADADRLQDLYLRGLGPPLVALLAGAAAVVAAAIMLPVAALVVACVLLAAGVVAPLLVRAVARRSGRRQSAARAALTATMVEIAGGAAEIALAGREDDWQRRAAADGERLGRVARRDALAGGLAAGSVAAIAAAATAITAAVAVPAVADGALDGVLLAALVLLALGSLEATAPLPAAAANLDAVAAAAARLEEVTERRPPVAVAADPTPLPALGPLALERVRFRHSGAAPWLLDGADLRLEPGRAVAICGASGAGKTTLAELLVRFRDPGAGRVTLGGADLRALDPEAVRSVVRLAAQDAYLFAASIRANVALARPGAADEEIAAALAAVGLGDWLATLPDGLDTAVGEAGARVSGGQRQRIAAARPVLSEAPYLLFDEPTTHLDPAGAQELLDRLAALAHDGGRGVLVITHERPRLMAYDTVLRLADGVLAPD
jgi:ATP-binding cassette, subfamily C, bacterial CydC